jgi:hypothetical protein
MEPLEKSAAFSKKLFDIPAAKRQPVARSRPFLNLGRKFLNSGVDFLPLSRGQVQDG